mmetsp:Transcript_25901/g.51607  ORF Transcript_25901/g.51607 Transcript_25901/m.51607 type:complete len:128 (-) Transcript_25901:75-458(-)
MANRSGQRGRRCPRLPIVLRGESARTIQEFRVISNHRLECKRGIGLMNAWHPGRAALETLDEPPPNHEGGILVCVIDVTDVSEDMHDYVLYIIQLYSDPLCSISCLKPVPFVSQPDLVLDIVDIFTG